MKVKLTFWLPIVALLAIGWVSIAQVSQRITQGPTVGTPSSATAISGASTFMRSVLVATNSDEACALLNIPPLEGLNGIVTLSSNKMSLDTNVCVVSGTSNVTFKGVIYGDGSGLTGTGSSTLLDHQGTTSEIKSTNTDEVVYTYSIPSIGAGKGIRWTVCCYNSAAKSGTNKLFKISFGGTVQQIHSVNGSSTTNPFRFTGTIMNNPASTTAQVWESGGFQSGGSWALVKNTSTYDTATAKTLQFLFNAPSTETIVGVSWIVESIQ